nr:MAG TPA: hypothetical protein [Caudoviricetes sp.]
MFTRRGTSLNQYNGIDFTSFYRCIGILYHYTPR